MSDSEIWSGVQEGDERAWRLLVERYQSLVYSVAARVGLSVADAGDCFQHTWLALFKHRKRIRDPRRLAGWLAMTARREAIRLSRQSSAHDSVEDRATPDTKPLPDEDLELLERQAHLENGLAQLDERCRKLVDLMFYAPEDWSYEEIARRLNIAPNSLGPIRRRCLERLKKIMSA